VDWFFRHSAYYDAESYMYPVGILYAPPAQVLSLAPFAADLASSDAPDFDEETPVENVVKALSSDNNVRSASSSFIGCATVSDTTALVAMMVSFLFV
jgi:hypothetical protein